MRGLQPRFLSALMFCEWLSSGRKKTPHHVWVTVKNDVLLDLLYYREISILAKSDYSRSGPKYTSRATLL